METKKLRVLVGCEYSGVVRDAFTMMGHDATSCDLLPTESPGKHYQGDVFDILGDGWDLAILHPPCTYLSSSGLHWNNRVPGRLEKTNAAIDFVKRLLEADIPKIALENPIGILSSAIRKPEQIIQPWQFGHPESKATCLWLKGLPQLVPTSYAEPSRYKCKCGNVFDAQSGKYGCCGVSAKALWDNQTESGQNKLSPSPNRAKIRSLTYKGIAEAMATQWAGKFVFTE
jgi:hypothetical protein